MNSRIYFLKKQFIFFIICFIGILPMAFAQDYWGKSVIKQPSDYIFGYGSLINTASRNSSVTTPIPAIPVRVSAQFGFARVWNDRAPSGFTALGLRKADSSMPATTINGVLFPVAGGDIAAYDKREEGYARIEVPRSQIEALSWQSLPNEGRIWVYVPVRSGGEPGVGLPIPNGRYPLLQSYIDVVVEGGLEYGEEYARELIATTKGWNAYWLNDRILARRPWVADTKYSTVDALLKRVPTFQNRLLPEDYAAQLVVSSK
ncbi:gamma-glutamylcyclotransferase [Polynucleobacter sp. 73C-SIWE]|uniref:gamma-glutamylcyclotransferase family protein n=1 Tax=Polynucleobacter sp. 73C-SIWE TaxID=2689098 RepID=UPI001C0D2857|nr:gamma-glutamylcyclotransferase family protein [Polynucleobacter sp. 73C-SIWE]MBU3579532.1 gamma-glutamylcyclotransferase [Polynucleobacter sp. 73C-SIWE]